jgi:hypothetical protein
MKRRAPDQVKTITLSDGTVATIHRPRGGHLIRAEDIATTTNRFKYVCAMLAQITELDGEPCVMEDIEELWSLDIDKLSKEATAEEGFLPLTEQPSPSSLNGVSTIPNSTK